MASSGLAIGNAKLILHINSIIVPKKRIAKPEKEINVFKKAILSATKKTNSLKKNLSASLPKQELEIYEAYSSIINDPEVIEKTINYVKQEKCNADYSYYQITQNFISALEKLEDNYVKQRAEDLKMLSKLVIKILQGEESISSKLGHPCIIVAEKIDPNLLAEFEPNNLLGLISTKGGVTDHTSIIAKALGIPYLLGVKNSTKIIKNGDIIIIDTKNECLHLNPKEEAIRQFEKENKKHKYERKKQLLNAQSKAYTKSGNRIDVLANVGSIEDARQALKYGADGIGLLRTELCFLESSSVPDEKTHLDIYNKILSQLPKKKHTLRLLDFGTDKKVSYLPLSNEENPAMGNRALRLGFSYYENLLKPQIRAFLRLSKKFDIKILCPMISTPEDLNQILDALRLEKKDLNSLGEEIEVLPPVGIMIEVPNVALNPQEFISKADFFSFGTNDLAQFLMAADRTNVNVSHYLEAANKSLLKLIQNFANEVMPHKKEISICGELASNSTYLRQFIDLGLSALSMPPSLIPKVKEEIKSID